MKNNKIIHVIGRALIFDNEHILLAREINSANTFLPGGHVEYNEGIANAIKRELLEEFDGIVEIGDFIGIIENSFICDGEPYYEINLLFSAKPLNFSFPRNPKSNEDYLEFFWHPVETLESANILPPPVIEFARKCLNKTTTANFASVLEK